MGYGDELMATGMAKGLARKKKFAAFGDGRKIIWSEQARVIFKGNPNIALPGAEGPGYRDLVWFRHYRGNRLYGKASYGHWVWNKDFRAIPGEVYLTVAEMAWAKFNAGSHFILVEPNVKAVAPNKQWPFNRYQALVNGLRADHHDVRVVQLVSNGQTLEGVETLRTPSFRQALAVLSNASLYVGPEGGLHHGAAALDVPAVVIFGGYIHPMTTGYATHTNIYDPTGAEPCGIAGRPCPHCQRVMNSISIDLVRRGVEQLLKKRGKDDNVAVRHPRSSAQDADADGGPGQGVA